MGFNDKNSEEKGDDYMACPYFNEHDNTCKLSGNRQDGSFKDRCLGKTGDWDYRKCGNYESPIYESKRKGF